MPPVSGGPAGDPRADRRTPDRTHRRPDRGGAEDPGPRGEGETGARGGGPRRGPGGGRSRQGLAPGPPVGGESSRDPPEVQSWPGGSTRHRQSRSLDGGVPRVPGIGEEARTPEGRPGCPGRERPPGRGVGGAEGAGADVRALRETPVRDPRGDPPPARRFGGDPSGGGGAPGRTEGEGGGAGTRPPAGGRGRDRAPERRRGPRVRGFGAVHPEDPEVPGRQGHLPRLPGGRGPGETPGRGDGAADPPPAPARLAGDAPGRADGPGGRRARRPSCPSWKTPTRSSGRRPYKH